MNVEALERDMPNILAEVPKIQVSIPTLFIRGALSNYILDDDISDIEDVFVDSEVVTIENAGHWVHAEAPAEFLDTLLSFCLR